MLLCQFYFHTSQELRETEGGQLYRALRTPGLWTEYFDPFNCECRAFGRLQQEERCDLARPAYGYLFLNGEQEAEVALRSNCTEDGIDSFWRRRVEHEGQPVRAIVKQLPDPNLRAFEPRHLATMEQDLEALHDLGILVRRINLHSYADGKLAEFGRAWTAPHPALEFIGEENLRRERAGEPMQLLDAMVQMGLHGS